MSNPFIKIDFFKENDKTKMLLTANGTTYTGLISDEGTYPEDNKFTPDIINKIKDEVIKDDFKLEENKIEGGKSKRRRGRGKSKKIRSTRRKK